MYPVLQPAHDADLGIKIGLVREAYDACQKRSPEIKKVKAGFHDLLQEITVVNSEGLWISDVRPLIRLTCVAIAEKGAVREYGFSGGGGRVGLESFISVETPTQIGREAADEAVRLLEAQDAPAGEMPVVLAPGHAGVLIHEAVGHLLEADFIRKKTSIFWNKMNRRVGSDLVTIYDDPTIPGSRGSYAVDDEGTIPERTLLIEKGFVRGLLTDRLSAKIMNRRPTGHGRRQDYTEIPIPRMSNTYIAAGPHDPEEILRSVKKGFYAERFTGGQVEDSGKFTFSVSSGYLIEDGRRTAPVKQATLIGTNVAVLKGIVMAGTDLTFGQQTGSCGKEGQDVPVNDGCPTLKIAVMTVGGRE
jgi:TldD protein